MNFSKVSSLSVSAGSILKCRDPFTIPIDLIIEIFSRLPVKSVARCRCLSKLWAKVIRSQYFIDLFAAKSTVRPQILFVYPSKFKLSSAEQPSENSSDNIALTHFTQGRIYISSIVSVPTNGLVCLSNWWEPGMLFIYNPTTGEFLPLPKMKKNWRYSMRSFLGYDPTKKQFKVLSLECNSIYTISKTYMECQVLTLETKELSWRMIECCKPHCPFGKEICISGVYPLGKEICINGVLYYLAAIGASKVKVIVCFDVRSETFRFMNVMETFNKYLPWTTILTNYDGKLGVLISQESNPERSNSITGDSIAFELWFLKDAEKHEWSKKHVYKLPAVWKNVVGGSKLIFIGMMGTNEIVLYPYQYCPLEKENVPPFIFYYNIKKNIVRRLNIQGMKASKFRQSAIFLNHVESLFKLRN